MNKGIRFTDEFKQVAGAQVVEPEYAITEVRNTLKMRPHTSRKSLSEVRVYRDTSL